MALALRDLALTYQGAGTTAVDVLKDINLEVATGAFVSLIGPSGCGKSSICNLIAGVENRIRGTFCLMAGRFSVSPARWDICRKKIYSYLGARCWTMWL